MKELTDKEVTLFFYLTLDDNGQALLQPIRALDNLPNQGSMSTNESIKYLGLSAVHGHSEKLGDFRVSFHQSGPGKDRVVHTAYLATVSSSPNLVKDVLQSGLRIMEDRNSKVRHISLAGTLFDKNDAVQQPNLVVHQVTGRMPFQLEVVYESNSFTDRVKPPLKGPVYDELLQTYRKDFAAKFEDKFRLIEKGYSESDVDFAMAAMSNLVGGIGYFHGTSKVQSVHNKEVKPFIFLHFFLTKLFFFF